MYCGPKFRFARVQGNHIFIITLCYCEFIIIVYRTKLIKYNSFGHLFLMKNESALFSSFSFSLSAPKRCHFEEKFLYIFMALFFSVSPSVKSENVLSDKTRGFVK